MFKLSFFLGLVPYLAMAVILHSIGVSIFMWQYWAALICMFVSDGISLYKGLNSQ